MPKQIEIEDILDKPVAFDDEETKESKKKVDEALETNDAFFDYQATAEKLIKDGFWEDFEGREELEMTKMLLSNFLSNRMNGKNRT